VALETLPARHSQLHAGLDREARMDVGTDSDELIAG
jgi:hypothetical protein